MDPEKAERNKAINKRIIKFAILPLAAFGILLAFLPDSEEAAAPESSVVLDVSSGRPLSEFEGSQSYKYREHLVNTGEAFLADMGAIRTGWDHNRSFARAMNTCTDIENGDSQDRIVKTTILRYEGGTTENVTDAEGLRILAAIKEHVCPSSLTGKS